MLKQRIITAVCLAMFVMLSLFSSYSIFWLSLLMAMVYIGFWEWCGLCQIANKQIVLFGFLVLSAVLAGLFYVPIGLYTICVVSCVLWLLMFLYTFTAKLSIVDRKVIVKLAIGILILSTAVYCVNAIKVQEDGVAWVLCFFVTVWAADIGAYFAGKRFGKTKLAPNISPGKTVEGVIGGVTLVLLIFSPIMFLSFEPVKALLVLLTLFITALVSVAGDLFESKLKRTAGIKDSSNILPGHGGVLDRIDGLLSGAPFFTLGLVAII